MAKHRLPRALALVASGCAAAMLACHAQEPASAPPAPEEDAGPHVSAVESSLVFTECPDAPALKGTPAEQAIHRLVEDCTHVPGGEVRFAAIFNKNGRIEFDVADGGSPDTMVPMCVLKHDLSHKLPVQRACRVEVRMVEQRVKSPAR